MLLWDEDAYSAFARTRGEEEEKDANGGHDADTDMTTTTAASTAFIDKRAEAEKMYSDVSVDRLETGIEALDYGPRVNASARCFVPGDVVELIGHSGCGKSQVLLQALANAVSMGIKVVLVDTDARFSPERFRAILDGIVKFHAQQDGKAAEETVDLWMMGLSIVRCPGGSTDLIAALSSLIIPTQPSAGQEAPKAPLRIIAIDTINAFYWEDTSEGVVGDLKQRSVQAAIERLRSPAQCAVIFYAKLTTSHTVPSALPGEHGGKYSYFVNDGTVSVAGKQFPFSIDKSGVTFLPSVPTVAQIQK